MNRLRAYCRITWGRLPTCPEHRQVGDLPHILQQAVSLGCLICIFGWAGLLAAADPASVGKPQAANESLEGWQYFQELQLPSDSKARYYDYLLPPDVLDKAQLKLGDVRLRDANDKEVPFAMRRGQAEAVRRPGQAQPINT